MAGPDGSHGEAPDPPPASTERTVVHLCLPKHRVQPGATVAVPLPGAGRVTLQLPDDVQPGKPLPLPSTAAIADAVLVIDLPEAHTRTSQDRPESR
jgi:hypothetical protein